MKKKKQANVFYRLGHTEEMWKRVNYALPHECPTCGWVEYEFYVAFKRCPVNGKPIQDKLVPKQCSNCVDLRDAEGRRVARRKK